VAKSSSPKTLDAHGLDWLCDKLIAGETQTAIAESLRIGVATLSRWIADSEHPERSARVREARIAAARSFDEKAEQELRDAKDPFTLARAKELAHHYRWKASKADPRGYGEKIEIDQRTTLTDLTDEQLDAKLESIEAKRRQAEDASASPTDAG